MPVFRGEAAMKRTFRRMILIPAIVLLLLLVGAVGGRHWYINSHGYELPYHVPFLMEAKDRWTALGGTWEVVDGTMRNDSNEVQSPLHHASARPRRRGYVA